MKTVYPKYLFAYVIIWLFVTTLRTYVRCGSKAEIQRLAHLHLLLGVRADLIRRKADIPPAMSGLQPHSRSQYASLSSASRFTASDTPLR